MSLLKKIGIGTGIGVVILGLGYLGYKYKKLCGKKSENEETSEVVESKDNIQEYYNDLLSKCRLTEKEVQELSNNYFNKKK